MQADLDIGEFDLINSDKIVAGATSKFVTIQNNANTSSILVGDDSNGWTETKVNGVTEFVGSDITRKMKIDCNGTTGSLINFNSDYKSFIDTFQNGNDIGWRLGISDTGDTSQSFLVAVNNNTNPENNAFACLVANNLAFGFINNSDTHNGGEVYPYSGIGAFSNTPGTLPTDKLSVRDGSIGL